MQAMWLRRNLVQGRYLSDGKTGFFGKMKEKLTGATSLTDKLLNAAPEAGQDQVEKAFRNQIQQMAKFQVYDVRAHLQILNLEAESCGLKGWRSYNPFAKTDSNQQKEIQQSLKIFESTSPLDRNRFDRLDREDKIRIAKAASVEVADINLAMRRFMSNKDYHQVLRMLHDTNQPLPQTPEEFQQVFIKNMPASYKKRSKAMQKPKRMPRFGR